MCEKCGHISCVCGVIAAHPDPHCKFRRSATCSVGIECEHGYDVCPICDPCTCDNPITTALAQGKALAAALDGET